MLQSGGEEKTPQFTPEEQQILKDNVQLLLAGNPACRWRRCNCAPPTARRPSTWI